MQLQTILNRVEKQKGFVYSNASFTENGELHIVRLPESSQLALMRSGIDVAITT